MNKITSIGQEVTYSFVVTNTGNVTLKDIVITDEMLEDVDVKVELDKTKLKPGEQAHGKATYKVTKADLDKSKLVNTATVTGTPPNYDPEDPSSEKPAATDSHEIPTSVEGPSLPKTATNTFNMLVVGLIILIAGVTCQGMIRRKKL